MPKNDWDEYKKLILHEMKENGHRFERIETILTSLTADVSGLKTKASIIGGVAGIIGTALIEVAIHIWK